MALIKSLDGRIVYDSRGEKTIEVLLGLDNGKSVSASVPHGKSRGSFEAESIEPKQAINNLINVIGPALIGLSPENQGEIDRVMMEIDGTKNKSQLGANAILGTSIACAKAAASTLGIPLWQHLRSLYGEKSKPNRSPRLFVNIINGGLHAKNNLPFQEYLIIPKSRNAGESLLLIRKIYDAVRNILETSGGNLVVGDEGGFAPIFKNYFEPFEILKQAARSVGLEGEVDFGLDAAANGINITKPKLFSVYQKMINEHHLFYLEDPFSEDDFKNFATLLKKSGGKMVVTGDDLTVTNLERMKKAKENGSINGMIVKPNQIGSVSETLQAIRYAKDQNWFVVVSHRSGETMDDFIADLAFAVSADGLKAGAPSQKERLVKYERLVAIESQES